VRSETPKYGFEICSGGSPRLRRENVRREVGAFHPVQSPRCRGGLKFPGESCQLDPAIVRGPETSQPWRKQPDATRLLSTGRRLYIFTCSSEEVASGPISGGRSALAASLAAFAQTNMRPAQATDKEKIADALRAGPPSITRDAALADWPANPKDPRLNTGFYGPTRVSGPVCREYRISAR
jgi:hypothetical protein